ncbi:hypothetical protein, partial [Escherichia coli]|uniref:hypothetical protein n=1 Tax=Escherichia coli TaxID=562 RepID=UPI002259D8B6
DTRYVEKAAAILSTAAAFLYITPLCALLCIQSLLLLILLCALRTIGNTIVMTLNKNMPNRLPAIRYFISKSRIMSCMVFLS